MKLITVVIGAVGLISFVYLSFLLISTPVDNWDKFPSTAIGAIIAASIAGVAALAATESASSRRLHEAEQAVNEKRKAVYDAAIQHLINAYSGGSATGEEARIRSLLSMWASRDVLDAMGEYNRIINRIHEANPHIPKGAPQDIPDSERPRLLNQVGNVAKAMRADVSEFTGPDATASSSVISRMIFNDHSGLNGDQPAE